MSTTFEPDFAGISRTAPVWTPKRPLRIAILGDFGGGAGQGRLQAGAALAERKPIPVEFDTLETAMRRLAPALRLPLGADGAPIDIELADLEAFHPDTIYGSVPLFANLASLRKRLHHTSQFAAAAAEVMTWAEGAGPRASSLARAAAARGSAPSRGATLSDFARLTGRPSASAAADDGDVGDLLRRVVGPFVKPAASPNKDALLAAVDAGLSDAMRALLHHPDFQTCEALWRGVDFLLRRLETSPRLQVHLLDLSAEEFAADLSAVADLAECGLYHSLVEAPAQEADGGYTYVVACYRFDATPPHAELLGRAAKVASHSGASLLTGIAIDPFADRAAPPHRLVSAAFTALRELPEASFLGLFGPRFLLRHPYGKRSDPVASFAFEEFSREAGLRGMLWGHPALLAASILANPGAPLTVDDLPFHHFVDGHGDSVALPCTDRMVSANVASLLRAQGINAVMAHKGEALVHLSGLQAVNGDGLAVQGAMPRKAPEGARFAVQSKIGSRGVEVRASFEPVARKGAAAAPTAIAAAAEDTAPSPVPAQVGERAVESADDELSALLASLDDAPSPADAQPAPEATIDDELDALLKSLG